MPADADENEKCDGSSSGMADRWPVRGMYYKMLSGDKRTGKIRV